MIISYDRKTEERENESELIDLARYNDDNLQSVLLKHFKMQ